jgi:hypothetical protein
MLILTDQHSEEEKKTIEITDEPWLEKNILVEVDHRSFIHLYSIQPDDVH